MITADALGVWVGLRGRRVPWADIAEIVIVDAAPVQHDTLGFFILRERQKQPIDADFAGVPLRRALERRLLDHHVPFEICTIGHAEVIAGVTAMAELAGYDVTRQSGTRDKVWAVVPVAGTEPRQRPGACAAEDPPKRRKSSADFCQSPVVGRNDGAVSRLVPAERRSCQRHR